MNRFGGHESWFGRHEKRFGGHENVISSLFLDGYEDKVVLYGFYFREVLYR
jgi:hypothetical protein